jgi:NitT/TauT family transport system substrate-binding protein
MTLRAGGLRAQSLDRVVHQLGWIKSIQFGGHFAAIHHGYFEEEGIEAEFLSGGPNSIGTDVAIATGQADTSDTDVPGTIRSRAGGMPIKAFAAIMQRAPGAIMSLSENPLTSVSDFVDKTIALPSGLQPQITSLMVAEGLDPASVTFVPVGTDPGMLAAGQVDGYYGWATNQGVMLMTRGVDINIAYMNDLGIPGYAGVITATDETIAERGDVLTRWLRAEIRGWEWHLANPEEMAELMVSTYGQRGLDLEAQTVESRLMADFVPIGDAAENGLLWVEPSVFEEGIAFEVATGGLEEGAVTVDDVVTQELIAAAHGTA